MKTRKTVIKLRRIRRDGKRLTTHTVARSEFLELACGIRNGYGFHSFPSLQAGGSLAIRNGNPEESHMPTVGDLHRMINDPDVKWVNFVLEPRRRVLTVLSFV